MLSKPLPGPQVGEAEGQYNEEDKRWLARFVGGSRLSPLLLFFVGRRLESILRRIRWRRYRRGLMRRRVRRIAMWWLVVNRIVIHPSQLSGLGGTRFHDRPSSPLDERWSPCPPTPSVEESWGNYNAEICVQEWFVEWTT